MAKYIVGVIVLVFIAAGAYYMVNGFPSGVMTPPEDETPPVTEPTTLTYATSTFQVTYPSDFTIDTSYQYMGVPNKPVDGVKFTIPMSMATGTNLSADSYVSIEWLPRAQSCTGDIYVLQNVKAHDMTDGGVDYSVATTSDAGAGNFYEEQVYALTDSDPCTAFRYVIHSTNINNYPAGAVQEFNRTALLNAFDSIRRSFHLGAPEVMSTSSADMMMTQ